MPNRYYCLSIIILLSSYTLSFSQQDPQVSQYMHNQLYINPAVTAIEASPKIHLLNRNQYIGYASNFDQDGVLNTQIASFQMPIKNNSYGIGLILVNDQAGLEKNQQVKLMLAKNFKLKKGTISTGISGGFYNKAFQNKFRPRQDGDPLLPTDNFSQIKPDIGIGVHYASSLFYTGISLNHANQPKFNYDASNGSSVIKQSIALYASRTLNINKKLAVKPSFLLRSDMNTYTLEGGALLFLDDKYWIGGTYRGQDAGIVMAGVSLLKNNALKLGAAYDVITSNKAIKSASSLEIFLSYALLPTTNSPANKYPIIRTPRFRH